MSDNDYGSMANNVWKWPILIILIAGALIAGGLILYNQSRGGKNIRGFEDCVKAGNPVQETYPEQCSANGRTYINTDIDPSKINNIYPR